MNRIREYIRAAIESFPVDFIKKEKLLKAIIERAKRGEK